MNRDKLITTNDRNAVPAKVVYEADTGKLRQQDPFAWYPGIDMVITEDTSYIITEDEIFSLDLKKLAEAEKTVSANIAEITALKKSIAELQQTLDSATDAKSATDIDQINRKSSLIDSMVSENSALRNDVFNWRVEKKGLASLVLAGGTVIGGGDGFVASYDAGSGRETWIGRVDGKAAGMAVHDGRLYVSTDKGGIYCFREGDRGNGTEIVQQVKKSPYPDRNNTDEYISSAEEILRKTKQARGWCLVLDSGEGRLAYELATRSELNIVGIERDAIKVRNARERLDEAGLLGSRVRIESWDIGMLPDYFANLIVSGDVYSPGTTDYPSDEMYRVLRPFGGVVCIGTRKAKTIR